jgi:signal transduction histidine kinase
MFPNLNVKLVLAFLFAVFVTVALTGGGSFVLLREELVRAERERVTLLLGRTWIEVQSMGEIGVSVEAIRWYLSQRAAEWKVRFLLVDQTQVVLIDTENELVGRRFDPIDEASAVTTGTTASGFTFINYEDGPQRQVVIAPPLGPRNIANITFQVPRAYDLYMTVPEDTITRAWRALLPRLGLPALAAMVVAGVIATLLARSIARRVQRVTRASEEMAHGRYDQYIRVDSRDEIGRLAVSFNEMAREVSHSHQMMRDLLGNVAHELKTPLTSIQGFSQALVDGAARTTEDQERAARIIHEEADRMRRLVNDLLYLSQIETGQVRMEKGPVDTAGLLYGAAERVAWAIRDAGLSLAVAVPADLPPLQADEQRLEQVLANLIDNAIQHTPAGGAITLKGEQAGASIVLTVHNTGSYISPEERERIFERFYRGDTARTRAGHNGGLGLAIAHEIVTAHGGRLDVHSDRDTGTEFRVVLPLPPIIATPSPRGGRPSRFNLRRPAATTARE